LGDQFGLTRLSPALALRHPHSKQVEGRQPCHRAERDLCPAMCAGFKATRNAHHLINRGKADVVDLEIGDRTSGDVKSPDGQSPGFVHKDGTPY
jgi:uncharacterized cupin superfamily protein